MADADEALALFQRGVRHKRVAETRMNAASSRSHCMLTLQVQQLATDRAEHILAEGRLTLVDLAGSERQQVRVRRSRRTPSSPKDGLRWRRRPDGAAAPIGAAWAWPRM